MALRIGLAYALILLLLYLGVWRWTALSDAGPPLDEAIRSELFRALRASLDPAPFRITAAHKGGARIGVARLFCRGAPVATVELRAASLAGEGFSADPAVAALGSEARRACRIVIDVFRGRGPIVAALEPLFAVSLIPGADALGLEFGGRELLLMPDELLREGLLCRRPLPQLDLELGLDARAALRILAQRAGADAAAWRRTPHRFFRVRVESWAEPADSGSPERLFRYVPARSAVVDRGSLRAAALAGARYLERHLHDDGRFGYQLDSVRGDELPVGGDYSVPRHAGAAFYLAQAAGAFGDARLRSAAARAIGYLAEHAPAGCDRPDFACAGLSGATSVDLGSSALALLAAAEYQERTGDARFLPWARRLARFLLRMQRADGSFRHLYEPTASRADDEARLLYYSGEATLALARLAALADSDDSIAPLGVGRSTLADAIDRGLAHLTIGDYDFFAGSFFFGEDHWTCVALDAAWDLLPPGPRREGYADFCEGFARFQERTRFGPGDGPVREQPDLVGAYGFTPLVPPHPTPVGSRAEALISVYRLARRRGHETEARRVAEGVRSGLRFLLSQQIRPDAALLMANPDSAEGGFLMSAVARTVRIDSVQHAGSAILRAADEAALFDP